MTEEKLSYDVFCKVCKKPIGVIVTKDRKYTLICTDCFEEYKKFREQLKNITDEQLAIGD